MPLITLGDDTKLKLKVPSKGDTNWESDFKTEFAQKIVDHDHTGVDGKGAKIAEAAIEDGAITTNKIADGAVTSVKIAADAVADIDLAPDSVGTSELKDDAVETANILDANVTTAKIADSNVTTAKIADANVTEAKLATGSVTNAKIGANAVNGGTQIINSTITGNKLQGDPMMGGAVNLHNLADVTGTIPSAGQILKWTQTNWDGMGGYQWAPGTDATGGTGGSGVDVVSSAAEAAGYSGTARIIHITATEDVTFGTDLTNRIIFWDQAYKLTFNNANLLNCSLFLGNDASYTGLKFENSSTDGTTDIEIRNCNIRCWADMEIDLSGNTAGNQIKFFMSRIEAGDIDILNANNSFVTLYSCVIHTTSLDSSTSSNATPVSIQGGSVQARLLKGVVNISSGVLDVTQGSSTSNVTIKDSGTTIFGPLTFPHAFKVIDGEIETKVNVIASTGSYQSIPHATSTTVIFGNEELDNTGSHNTTTGIFTAPVKGVYSVSSQILLSTTNTFDAGHLLYIQLYVNSSLKWTGSLSESVVTNTQSVHYGSQLSAMVNVNEGDEITIRAYQSSGVSQNLLFQDDDNYLHIHKIN